MSLEDRIRRLDKQTQQLDVPSPEEVSAAFGRIAERARSRFRGEHPAAFEERRGEDQETVDRW